MSVIVEWEEVVGAVTYNVYRSPDNTPSSYTLVASAITNVYNDPTGSETDYYQIAGVDVQGAEGDISGAFHSYTTETHISPVATCRVFGTILDINGHPDPELDVTFEIDRCDAAQFQQTAGLTVDTITRSTNRDGFFEANLVQGALVTLFIKSMRYRIQFAVPVATDLDYKDIVGVIKTIHNPF